MGLSKNPAILIGFSGELIWHKLTFIAQVEMKLVKHLLNTYYQLSIVELQCVKEKYKILPCPSFMG